MDEDDMGHKKFFTKLYPKKLNIRNNVKSSMIQEFLFRLHGCMDDDDNVISSIYNVPVFEMIPLACPDNALVEWSSDRQEIPCLNVDCEWIQFMILFYKSYKLFLLPGLAPDGYCKICHMAHAGILDWSKIKLSSKSSVSLV